MKSPAYLFFRTPMVFIACASISVSAWGNDHKTTLDGTTASEDQKSQEVTIAQPVVVTAKKLEKVNAQQLKSADLAEAISRQSASVSLVRRSGIANDIILRGQKKDNINVLVDGCKIHGACPNRMDPPTSHILANNVESVEIEEGPFDVENFGTLSGKVSIQTRKPGEGFNVDLGLNTGSWNYNKLSGSLGAGSEAVRFFLAASTEDGDQYEDGNGNTFADQVKDYKPATTRLYKTEYEDVKAFDKSSAMGKLFWATSDLTELQLGYTLNRSGAVLYPNTPMDALYDDSDIFDAKYILKEVCEQSDELSFALYSSKVDHPMSNEFRQVSMPTTNHMKSSMGGFKIKNKVEVGDAYEVTYGLDLSRRNWNGTYSGAAMVNGKRSIDDVDTDNRAFFASVEKAYDLLTLKGGVRLDTTDIASAGDSEIYTERDFNTMGGFVSATYQITPLVAIVGGVGRSHRVPDARELYFYQAMGNKLVGNPDLEEVANTEFDVGVDVACSTWGFKVNTFYSSLDNYIVYNASKSKNNYENVDAHIYGCDINGSWRVVEKVDLGFSAAYQRGKKESPLDGQSGTNLAEIPPIKGSVSVEYEYKDNSYTRLEWVASDSWSRYDSENGEQRLDSWSTLNFKVRHSFTHFFTVSVGVDNIFDKTYAVSNTYQDLTLVSGGSTGETLLMNEPGRNFYTHFSFSF